MASSSSSTSGSCKRARAGNNGGQVVCCSVDGCNSDLSNSREYHRRHKVCELHSKTPQVSIAGLIQRFCQQCSRFHSLEEFDEGKRSCRKRLDGHNRRRRKPQGDLLPPSGSFFSCHQGSPLLPFSSSQVFPAVQTDPPASCRPFLRTVNAPPEKGGEGNKMVYNRFTIGDSEMDCALSLLSSPPALAEQTPAAESSGQMGFSIPDERHGDGFINFEGMFGIGSDSAGNESPPSTLPFHWEY